MNCSEIRPNLEAYALGALDPLTRSQVDKHLKTCPACQLTLQSLRSAVGGLPDALATASALRPPASLKANILRAAQAELDAEAAQTALAIQAQSPVQPARRGHWLHPSRARILALGASAIVIAALVGWAITTNVQMHQALVGEQAALQQINALQNQQELAVPVLNSATAQVIALDPTDIAPNAAGKILIEPGKPTIVFVGFNLPQPPLSQEYILWTTTKGIIRAAGQFTPNANGFAMVAFVADRSDPILKEIFVTQQAPSSVEPSADRVLVWKANPNESNPDITFGSSSSDPADVQTRH